MAVVDFETTGLSPSYGARSIEIAVVLISDGRVVDTYASLMNPGISVPYEITQLTGITTPMVRSAPPTRSVMQDAVKFIGTANLVAHNDSFDKKFLDGECAQIGFRKPFDFLCTMLLSRRLFHDAPNHKLGTLIRHLGLPNDSRLHRALADAQVTAELMLRIQSEIAGRHGFQISYQGLRRLQKTPMKKLDAVIEKLAAPA